MNKNGYNSNESKYQEVIKLLKELPKEKAAENFEYNLMVKIKNGNFNERTVVNESFSFKRFFVPTAGFAVTAAAVIFFLSNVNEEVPENPFQIPPQLRTEISGNIKTSLHVNKLFGKHKITDKDVVLIEPKKSLRKKIVALPSKPKRMLAQRKGIAALPFDVSNSTNLDIAIKNRKIRTAKNFSNRASLVGMNSTTSSGFNGFYIGEELSKQEVEAMKARIDSIKRYFMMHKK